jgi:hypothetical protein
LFHDSTLAEQLTHPTTCLLITDRGKKHGIGAHKRPDSHATREDALKTLSEVNYTTGSDFSQDREDKIQRVSACLTGVPQFGFSINALKSCTVIKARWFMTDLFNEQSNNILIERVSWSPD